MNNIYRALLSLNATHDSSLPVELAQEVHCRTLGEPQRITFGLASCRIVASLQIQPADEPVLLEVLDVIAVTENSREISPDYEKSNALWESGTQYLFNTSSPRLSYIFPVPTALTSISLLIAYRSSGDELKSFIVERLKDINRRREADFLSIVKANDELKARLFLQKEMIIESIGRCTAMERFNAAAKILFPSGTLLRSIYSHISKRLRRWNMSDGRKDIKSHDADSIKSEPSAPAGTGNEEREERSPAALLQKRISIPSADIRISPDKAAFTVVSKNHLARALALRDSFQAFNQGCDFIIFLVDLTSDVSEIELLSILIESGVDIRCIHELGRLIRFRNFGHMLLRYNILEANRAFRPFCFDYLLKSSYRKIIYLDSDTFVTGPFDECYELLDSFSMILSPNILEPVEESSSCMQNGISDRGVFSPGFLALRKSEKTRSIIEWWEDKAYYHGYMAEENSRAAESPWVDFFPSLCSDLHIMRDRGYNAAGWNLHERPVWIREGQWKAGTDRLIFFHFSGYLSDEFSVSLPSICGIDERDESGIAGLFNDYGEKLGEYSSLLPGNMKYYYSRAPSCGCRIRDDQRRAVTESSVNVDVNPFIPGSGVDIALCDEHRRSEFIKEGGATEEMGDMKTGSAGLTLAGHFSSIAGISQIARFFASSLFRAGIPFTLQNSHMIQHPEIEVQTLARFANCFTDELPYRLILLFFNCDETIQSLSGKVEMLSSERHRAAVWWWEFESGFEPFMKGFDHVDELLVFNDFLRDFYVSIAPRHVRIHKLLCPFIPDWTVTESQEEVRNRYGLMNDEFVFFFHFDCYSSIMRKNPAAVVRSFAQAFRGRKSAKLVLKMNNVSFCAGHVKELISMIDGLGVSERVVVIDDPLPRNGLISLINATDCYISLHRGEGLGLGILEAMALGKPVICTAYGGNMEFTRNDNSFLVEYAMVDAKPDIEAYRCVRQWAEPSTEQAAEYMRILCNDRDMSRKTGERARQFIRSYFSPERSVLDILKYVRDRL